MAFLFSNLISLVNKGGSKLPLGNFTGANAVWSTRLRITTYSGACLQLRRSTDSVIADFYADTSGNLGTALGATGTSYLSWKGAATTFVVTWYDQSGINNNMIQSITDNQPIYSIINGIGTLTFNGSTSFLTTSVFAATLNTPSFTIISSATNLTSNFGTLISSRQTGPLRGYTFYKDDTNKWYFQFGTTAGAWGNLFTNVDATANIRFILGVNQSKTTNTIASTIRNVSTGAVTTVSTSSTNYTPAADTILTRIGAGATETSPQFFYTGYINDLFYFGASLSDTQQTNVSNLLYNDSVFDIPYAYYTFDQADVDGTNVLNRTSTFYDASLSSTAILDGSNNISGTTDLSLNAATSQFVTINSPMDIGKSNGLSILFWVRYGTTNSNGTRIFDFGNDPASDNIELYIDSIGIPFLSIYSGSTLYAYSFGYPLNSNTYKHIGITMAADGTFKYYIDGVLYKTTTGNQYPADIVRTKNYIGKSSNNALFFNGGVGELRIYNNVVSSAVVLNNMNTNIRLYNNSFMTHNYGFKYADLQNGLIKNLATGVYDASFLTPVDATFSIVSTTKQIGITTGTLKQNLNGTVPMHIFSRINSNFLYNLPIAVNTGTAPTGKSVDSNYGIQILNGFTTPSTGGFTVNFWFYTLTTTTTYDLPFFSFNNGNTTAPITSRITFGINSTVAGAASTSLWVNTVKDGTNNKNEITANTTPGSYVNNGWHQYTLIVDYAAQTMRSYIDIDSVVFTHTYLDFSNTTFNYCTLMNDITYAGFDYNRPVQGFMDNFRIYNVPLRISELRQLTQIPVTPAAKVYTLRPMSVAAPVNGNVAVYMNEAASTVYMSAGVGNLYVGNVSTGTWTQSTLAAGSSGQLTNRNWRDIVCNSTGQYVVACVFSATANDPLGTVFYSSDYGSTYTQSASVIDTTYCFNLAMSADGNYTYMTAWGTIPPNYNTNNAYGNLYTSLDKGVTWSKITDVSGAGITVGNPSWASVPAQVRCNSTGEYVSLGIIGKQNPPILLSNYGHQLINTSFPNGYGSFNSNPVITNRASDNALIASVCGLAHGGNRSYYMEKYVYQIANKTSITQTCSNTPLLGGIAPQTTSLYQWSGARNVCIAQDRNQMVVVDTAGLGNVFVTTNGLQTAPWPESTGFAGISCLQDVINLSIPNVVSQTAVPRSAWSGVCVNWNDQFAFANKTGTVYLYTWTLQ